MSPNMKATIIILTLIAIPLLSGCTFVKYKEGNLTVVDVHPGGESLVLDGEVFDKGRVSVNRDKGSVDSTVEAIGEAVDRNIGL